MKVDLVDFDETHAVARLAGPTARIARLFRRFPAASKGLIALGDQGVVSVTNFVTAVIVARATSPEHLGSYYLTLSIVLVVIGVQNQLVAAPFQVYSKRRHGRELAKYTGSAWAHHFVLTALTMVTALAAVAIVPFIGDGEMTPGLWALLGAAPLMLLREEIRQFAFAGLDLLTAAAVDTCVAAVQLGMLALLAYYGQLTLLSIYAAMAAACALASLGWFIWRRTPVTFERRRYLPDWRINWAFGKWALQSYLVGSTTPYAMLWILNLTVTAAAAGVLGACNTLVGVMYVFMNGMANVLTPQAAHAYAVGGSPALRRVLAFTGTVFVVVLGAVSLGLFATGDWLPTFVFGDQYRGSGMTLAMLALSALATSLSVVIGNGLWAIDQPRANFMADVCNLVVTLATAALLVPTWAETGAAFAILAGTVVSTTVRYFILQRALATCESSTMAQDVLSTVATHPMVQSTN